MYCGVWWGLFILLSVSDVVTLSQGEPLELL